MWNVIAWMWNTSHRLLSWMLLALFWEVLKFWGRAKSLGMSFETISYTHSLSTSCLPQYKQLFSVTSFLPQQADTFETRSQDKPLLSVSIWMQNVLQRLNCLSICFPAGATISETLHHLDIESNSQIRGCRSRVWELCIRHTTTQALCLDHHHVLRRWETVLPH